MKTKQQLVDEVWQASNLTILEAEQIIDAAIALGQSTHTYHHEAAGLTHAELEGIIRDLAAL